MERNDNFFDLSDPYQVSNYEWMLARNYHCRHVHSTRKRCLCVYIHVGGWCNKCGHYFEQLMLPNPSPGFVEPYIAPEVRAFYGRIEAYISANLRMGLQDAANLRMGLHDRPACPICWKRPADGSCSHPLAEVMRHLNSQPRTLEKPRAMGQTFTRDRLNEMLGGGRE